MWLNRNICMFEALGSIPSTKRQFKVAIDVPVRKDPGCSLMHVCVCKMGDAQGHSCELTVLNLLC